MNLDRTEIILIVDRSTSMNSMREEAQGGVNNFIAEQAKLPGEAFLTLAEFDDRYNLIHDHVNIKQVTPYHLEPRGMTALLDAIGLTVDMVGKRLSETPEAERPGLVVVVIVTDGMENASKLYNANQIREMIEHQESVYQWQFNFLAAGLAVTQGHTIGIKSGKMSAFSVDKVDKAYMAASSNVTRMRGEVKTSGGIVSGDYTDQEKADMA